jgi:cell wall assembly regulator SMI1
MMSEYIARLDTWLRQNAPAFYEVLGPGLSDEEIIDLERHLNVTLPEDFKEFYRWKNGETANADFYPWNGVLMSAEWICQKWCSIPGMRSSDEVIPAEELDKELRFWNPKWVPFLDQLDGNLVCVDTEGSFGGKRGQILWFIHDDDHHTILHESMTKWIETVVTLLENPSFTDEEGIDPEAYGFLAAEKQVNPGYPKTVCWEEYEYLDEAADTGDE